MWRNHRSPPAPAVPSRPSWVKHDRQTLVWPLFTHLSCHGIGSLSQPGKATRAWRWFCTHFLLRRPYFFLDQNRHAKRGSRAISKRKTKIAVRRYLWNGILCGTSINFSGNWLDTLRESHSILGCICVPIKLESEYHEWFVILMMAHWSINPL